MSELDLITSLSTLRINTKPILIILDLNGLLCQRVYHTEATQDDVQSADKKLDEFYIFNRPHVHEFLEFLMDRFTVGVWSSAMERNVQLMVHYLFTKDQIKDLLFIWDQSHCQKEAPAAETPYKPTFLKPLAKVWSEFPNYMETKTLLIDDSPIKSSVNPPFVSIHPKSWKRGMKDDTVLLESLRPYLQNMGDDVPVYVQSVNFS